MPWTEHFYQGDNGFYGGQDIEFGLLGMAIALGLALLLPTLGKRLLERSFALREHISHRWVPTPPRLVCLSQLLTSLTEHRSLPPGTLGCMPLQV